VTRLRIDRTLSVGTFCRVHFFFPPFSRFIGIDFSCVENVRQWQRHGTQSKGGVFIFALQLETFVAYSRSSLPEIDIGDTYVGVGALLPDGSPSRLFEIRNECPEIYADVFPFFRSSVAISRDVFDMMAHFTRYVHDILSNT